MPKRPFKISPLKASRRWRKEFRGVQYYFPFSQYPTREAAWLGWLRLKAELDANRQAAKPHREQYAATTKTLYDLAAIARDLDDQTTARMLTSEAERLMNRFNMADNPPPVTPHEQDAYRIVSLLPLTFSARCGEVSAVRRHLQVQANSAGRVGLPG
jgi:hypothetical protein